MLEEGDNSNSIDINAGGQFTFSILGESAAAVFCQNSTTNLLPNTSSVKEETKKNFESKIHLSVKVRCWKKVITVIQLILNAGGQFTFSILGDSAAIFYQNSTTNLLPNTSSVKEETKKNFDRDLKTSSNIVAIDSIRPKSNKND
ncbi:hypothetical protein Avbf_03494 [Armadillidium vulgare]|nr:hypothetical protein Avbf_03494 [Armadillidium vulgare]